MNEFNDISELKPFRLPIQVRFRDLDAMGHLNNSVYHTYTELGRILLFQRSGLADPLRENGALPIILARTEIDFLLPGEMSDRVSVNSWLSRVGTKSFTVNAVVHSEQRGPLARSRAILVWYDYAQGRSVTIPEAPRADLLRLIWEP